MRTKTKNENLSLGRTIRRLNMSNDCIASCLVARHNYCRRYMMIMAVVIMCCYSLRIIQVTTDIQRPTHFWMVQSLSTFQPQQYPVHFPFNNHVRQPQQQLDATATSLFPSTNMLSTKKRRIVLTSVSSSSSSSSSNSETSKPLITTSSSSSHNVTNGHTTNSRRKTNITSTSNTNTNNRGSPSPLFQQQEQDRSTPPPRSKKNKRIIPPTELEIQQLKRTRQKAYEDICGGPSMEVLSSSSMSSNDEDDDPNTMNRTTTTILIDTGATYNANKEYIRSIDSTTNASTTTSSDQTTNLDEKLLPTPILTNGTFNDETKRMMIPTTTATTNNNTIMGGANTSSNISGSNVGVILDNVYVEWNTTASNTIIKNSSIQTNTTTRTQQLLPRNRKPPVSIWSFESLFPEPVLDTESIEKDLYRKNPVIANSTTSATNQTITTTGTTAISRNNSTKVTVENTVMPRSLPTTTADGIIINSNQQQEQSNPPLLNNIINNSNNNRNTFLYGGSGMIRKEKKKSLNVNSTTNGTDTNNSTQKVDPLLTRMVEDRVYGYRRLPTGVLQYETSLIGPDNAVQFRNGIRLSNPLPINADILSYLAKKELHHGRIDEAGELYERAVSIDPADGRAYLGLSKCAERRRDFTLARKWLIQGIKHSVSVQKQQEQQRSVTGSDSSPSNTNTNRGNKISKDNEERYAETSTLIPDRGANPFLLQALGCLEEKLGRLTQAETCYTEAVKSRPYHTAAWVSLAVLRTRKLGYPVRAGRECYQCAEYELQAAQQLPSSYIYTSWANLEYHKANDKNRARDLFQKAIQIDPQCSAAWLQLGVLEAACENWDAAELCFDTVMKFDQRNTRILQAYAIMETKRPSGDSRKAIGLFERAVQTNPRDAGVYQPYALYVAELGDMSMARSLLQKGTQVNKRHAAVWQAWGVLETRYGDADTARKIFQEGIWACGQVSGSQSGGYHCDRLWQAWGVLEANEKQYAAARRCFNRALDANNRNVPAFTAWALMEEQLGNVKDARMIFERGLHKFSTGSEEKKALYRSYELMEQRLGDTTAAQNIYQRSVRESFTEKDDVETLKASVMMSTTNDSKESFGNDGTSSQQQAAVKKKTKEFEVVRWENTGGEVWLNDRAIEAKVSISKKSRSSRDGSNKNTSSNNNNDYNSTEP